MPASRVINIAHAPVNLFLARKKCWVTGPGTLEKKTSKALLVGWVGEADGVVVVTGYFPCPVRSLLQEMCSLPPKVGVL